MSKAVAIEFTWSSKDLAVWSDRRIEKAAASALSKAGGDAIRALRVASSREIRSKKRFKVKRVNEALPLEFPFRKDIDGMRWTMRVSGRAFRVSDFPYRETKAGVVVSINTGRKVLIHSAFEVTLKSGHVGVFTRRGAARKPIDEAFTTRISDVFKNAGMIPEVMFRAQTVFARSFERLLPLELAKVAR